MLRKVLKIRMLLMIFAMAVVAATPSFAHEGHSHGSDQPTKVSAKGLELREKMRDLWIGHIFWVRNVALMTKVGASDGAKVAEEHVVQNARAIADAIGPMYGKAAADRLFGLLAAHYGTVKAYMDAAYAGNEAGKDAARQKMIANANEIASFLSSANPNWPKETLVSMLVAHGGHHMTQIDALARNDYRAEAQVWEPMKDHMKMIADALAAGIVKQFPHKF